MDFETFAVEAEKEETHWWFAGRRYLFAREIKALAISPDDPVLDIGTSTGTNLRMLKNLGYRNVTGLEKSEDAICFCQKKGLGSVKQGDVCAMDFPDNYFSLILATDIIEHVDDDSLAMTEIARVLKPDGVVLITVPTFKFLWGLQDDKAHHKRRYLKKNLITLLKQAGLVPQKHYYFNYLLFFPIWIARRLIALFHIQLDSENEIGSPVIDRILRKVFMFDVRTAPYIKPPFGVSALVIAKKS